MPKANVDTGCLEFESLGYRLAVTRRALGYTQDFIAKLIGLAAGKAWSNYEVGYRRIEVNAALRLCHTCGVTLEWIYRGDLHSLNDGMRRRIEQIIIEERSLA